MPHTVIPYLQAQLLLHPSMTPQDVAKLCYQAAHGAEHLLADPDRARSYLLREWEATAADDRLPLIEPISDAIARVNLSTWKARGLSAETLFDLFAASCSVSSHGSELLRDYLDEVDDWVRQSPLPFSFSMWQTFLAEYRLQGCPPVHHSEAYRAAEKPAYRIVRRDLLMQKGFLNEG